MKQEVTLQIVTFAWCPLKPRRHDVTLTTAPGPPADVTPSCPVPSRPAGTHRLSHLQQAGQAPHIGRVQGAVSGGLAAGCGGDGGVRHADGSDSHSNTLDADGTPPRSVTSRRFTATSRRSRRTRAFPERPFTTKAWAGAHTRSGVLVTIL